MKHPRGRPGAPVAQQTFSFAYSHCKSVWIAYFVPVIPRVQATLLFFHTWCRRILVLRLSVLVPLDVSVYWPR
jgi:hypothetical protein